jgi:TctA family transporter
MESHDIPIGPMMLGIVLGGLLEQSFMTSMIKADGKMIGFFERPIAAGLSVITLCIWSIMLYRLLSGISNQNARRQA